jgi:hypothetical protein
MIGITQQKGKGKKVWRPISIDQMLKDEIEIIQFKKRTKKVNSD